MNNRKAGIYRITSPSGKCYIGSAVNYPGRWRLHRAGLLNGTHHNRPLMAAASKYGVESLKFELIISVLDQDALLEYEQIAIDQFRPEYNIRLIAASNKGLRWTEETIERMRRAAQERASDPEWAASHAAANKARSADPEWQERNAATWNDPGVREARGIRCRPLVTVDGVSTEYESVYEAFAANGLPLGAHIPFRKSLKESGTELFEFDGKAYWFDVVERTESEKAAYVRSEDHAWRAAIAAANLRKSSDPEWREKISAARSDPEWRGKIADQWNDPAIRAARTARRSVRVAHLGVEEDFKSVGTAFKKLGLTPFNAHIRLRGNLNKSGREVFRFEGVEYVFELVE